MPSRSGQLLRQGEKRLFVQLKLLYKNPAYSPSLSQEHWLDNFLLTISGIVAAGSGIVLGGLVLFSVVSGPVGWSVFAGVSAAMGVVALVAGLIDVINGGQERQVKMPTKDGLKNQLT